MVQRAPFPLSRIPACIENSMKLVCVERGECAPTGRGARTAAPAAAPRTSHLSHSVFKLEHPDRGPVGALSAIDSDGPRVNRQGRARRPRHRGPMSPDDPSRPQPAMNSSPLPAPSRRLRPPPA